MSDTSPKRQRETFLAGASDGYGALRGGVGGVSDWHSNLHRNETQLSTPR